MNLPKRDYRVPLLFALLLSALIPWFIVQANMSINADLAYLTSAALRLLAGEGMSAGYYDSNPPLSILVQIPPALLVKYAGVPVYYAVLAYGIAAVSLSALAVHMTLKCTGWLTQEQRRTLVLVYILMNTVGAGLYLGEKDQLVALSLFPLVLVQAAMTQGVALDRRLQGAVIAAASVLILLKPHYGLVSLALFAHRAIVQRRLSIIKDPDFIGLASGAVLYGLIVFAFFPDFIYVILPDVLRLYVPQLELWAVKYAVFFGIGALAFAGAAWLLFEKPHKPAAALFALAALCIVPYGLQGKGFFYHALPALGFGVCALALLLERLLQDGLRRAGLREKVPAWAQAGTLLAFVALFYTITPPNTAYPTHAAYRNSQFAQIIDECERPDCTFFLFNDMIEMTQQLAVYTGQTHASRFPVLWWAPSVVRADYARRQWKDGTFSPEQVGAYINKYSAMLVEDFKKYQPDTLVIGYFRIVPDAPDPFDFIGFFSDRSPAFRAVMDGYERTDSITVDRSDYFGGTLVPEDSVRYDIYKKKNKGHKKDWKSKE